MAHELKFNYSKSQEDNQMQDDEKYPGASNVRNVCFVQPDGSMLFLNYGYLISGEYIPEESQIGLYFTSHSITLRGTKLQELFKLFLEQKPKTVYSELDRFKELSETETYFISSIEVEKK